MKPQLKAVPGKLILGTSLLIALSTAQAQTVTPAPADRKSENTMVKYFGTQDASAAEVKYIAGKDGEVIFNVVYNNATGQRFGILVLDEFGNQLYQNFFSDTKFDRKFKLADPESTNSLTFIIRNYGDNSVQRFRVDAGNR
jgi:hypothetical protein